MLPHLTRPTFLKSAGAALAWLGLSRFLTATTTPLFWFLHTASGDTWPVDDPVAWSLENARQPILGRARERLVTLDATDRQRVIRLVTRRCQLNLIEIHPRQVVVHYWGQHGRGDMRPLFKKLGLARKEFEVFLMDRKREQITLQSGGEYLYGQPLPPVWPLNVLWLNRYWKKWQRRHIEERDDWTAAPDTWSGFGWEGIEPNLIPWAALKRAWRRTTPMLCPNCDQATILTNFGFPQCSMFNREARFIHVCRICRRLFRDHSIKNVDEWLVANLDSEVWPDYDIFWGKASKWESPHQ